MLEDRIIVQDRGIDAGLAALMQNANKGMDPAALMADNASKFNIVGAKIDAQTQMINDKFCQLEMREMQNKIDALREDKQALQLSASQQAQTANIVNQIRPCPVPAYLTCNPFGCQGGLNDYGYGYGYGYNNGCGCGC